MPPAETTAARLNELRRLISRHASRGGHGPLPQRGVNADTVRAVEAQLRKDDLPLLVELLADDDEIVRLGAAIVLSRADRQAARLVRQRIAGMPDGTARQRLQQALIELPDPPPP